MKRLWKGCLGLALGLAATRGNAQDLQWHPAPGAARPLVTLGRPEAVEPPAPAPGAVQQTGFQAQTPTGSDLWMVRSQAPDPLYGPTEFTQIPPPPPAPATTPFVPQPAPGGSPFAPAPGSVPAPPPPPAGANIADPVESYLCGVNTTSKSGGFFDHCKEGITGIGDAVKGNSNRQLFQSDHQFDNFISPLTNPFFFEDPRALTEVRPLVLYQQVPGSNYAFGGGNVWFYGLQGRVAITDMVSLVVDKLGFVTTRPEDTSAGFTNSTGFAEVSLGPKFTFFRCDSSKTVMAAGLKFDVAAGSGSVYQDVGDLSLVPYFSVAQRIAKTSYGTFNFMNTDGYSFSVDDKRSDFFYTSFHFDFDVLNLNKIFPLIELNYFHYTSNGKEDKFFGFEGADLFNLGSGGVAGQNDLILAVGARYKFAEWFQIGAGVEFPLLSQREKEMEDYRFTVDLIFRY